MKKTLIHKTCCVSIGIVFLFLFSSCQKSGSAAFSNLPVVEAYLSPGAKISVQISGKIPYEENAFNESIDLNTLDLRIKYNAIEYPLTPEGNGIYTDTAGAITVSSDRSYSLLFLFNGNLVTSQTIIPEKPTSVTQSVTTLKMAQFDPENSSGTRPPDPVEINFENSDASYYLLTVECMETTLVPVIKDSIPANDMLASMPVTGDKINIQPMQIRYFGRNRIILYHINPEYSTFFMHQASNSQNYEEPPSNIENGLGIFTGINADTLYLNVVQL
jgi:hypothetical protein